MHEKFILVKEILCAIIYHAFFVVNCTCMTLYHTLLVATDSLYSTCSNSCNYTCILSAFSSETFYICYSSHFFRHLLVNPKERRVVIVESLLLPTVFRNTIAKVLFQHYEVKIF